MTSVLSQVSIAIGAFASTNLDDIFLLAALFAVPGLRPRAVVIGQYLGILGLLAASYVTARLAVAVPRGWTGLLGLVPLWMGIRGLLALRHGPAADVEEASPGPAARMAARGWILQAGVVTAITVGNGGDNLVVYIPLLARAPETLPMHLAACVLLTALWCALGYRLVTHPLLGRAVRRYGHVALPLVLLALGAWILADARVLLDQGVPAPRPPLSLAP